MNETRHKISVIDDIGRPLYFLDRRTGRHYHPYTGEEVPVDWLFNYRDNERMWKGVALGVVAGLVLCCTLMVLIYALR
jgi:hypothetical protein